MPGLLASTRIFRNKTRKLLNCRYRLIIPALSAMIVQEITPTPAVPSHGLLIFPSKKALNIMPSPIAHLSVGYLLYRFFARHLSFRRDNAGELSHLLLIATFLFLSMAPDLDSVVGILTNQMGRYHNNWTHSLIACIGISMIGAIFLSFILRNRLLCFVAALSCCSLHILMDYFSCGRGVMLLWPVTSQRFSPPIHIFMGLHWSQGVWSPLHLLTILNELLFVAILLAIEKFTSLLQSQKNHVS